MFQEKLTKQEIEFIFSADSILNAHGEKREVIELSKNDMGRYFYSYDKYKEGCYLITNFAIFPNEIEKNKNLTFEEIEKEAKEDRLLNHCYYGYMWLRFGEEFLKAAKDDILSLDNKSDFLPERVNELKNDMLCDLIKGVVTYGDVKITQLLDTQLLTNEFPDVIKLLEENESKRDYSPTMEELITLLFNESENQ